MKIVADRIHVGYTWLLHDTAMRQTTGPVAAPSFLMDTPPCYALFVYAAGLLSTMQMAPKAKLLPFSRPSFAAALRHADDWLKFCKEFSACLHVVDDSKVAVPADKVEND